jgi:recombination protein RecT
MTQRGNGQTPAPQRIQDRVITSVTDSFNKMLPAPYKPMAERMLARAKFYIARTPTLLNCTYESLCQCVLSAGEHGLCLDGKMAYAVPYGQVATYMPSYIGIIDVCRRHGGVKDAYARNVYKNDHFYFGMKDAKWTIEHVPATGERGEYLGSYAVVIRADGDFIVDYMNNAEIEKIRNCSKAKNAGPWTQHTDEMRKKTVVRRAIKTYISDPEVLDLLQRDNDASGLDTLENETRTIPASKSLDHLADRLSGLPAPTEPEAMDFGGGYSEPIEVEAKRPRAAAKKQAVEADDEAELAAEAARREALEAGELFEKGPSTYE